MISQNVAIEEELKVEQKVEDRDNSPQRKDIIEEDKEEDSVSVDSWNMNDAMSEEHKPIDIPRNRKPKSSK